MKTTTLILTLTLVLLPASPNQKAIAQKIIQEPNKISENNPNNTYENNTKTTNNKNKIESKAKEPKENFSEQVKREIERVKRELQEKIDEENRNWEKIVDEENRNWEKINKKDGNRQINEIKNSNQIWQQQKEINDTNREKSKEVKPIIIFKKH